ncbi:MAG: hypothetical protein ACETVY_01700 [Candidatus Bathyarchaeia archaeon]
MPRKTVAIRGLDIELYHEVFTMAKKDGKRVAEVMNKAMETYLNGDYEEDIRNADGGSKSANIFTLKNDGEISLSKNDIISLRKEVGLFKIETSGKLVFEKDIDLESLKHINKIIVHDGTVEVPRGLYPQVLIRSEIFGKIEKY